MSAKNLVCYVPCGHGTACPRVANGEDCQIWRADVNILNKQLCPANKGYKMLQWVSEFGEFFG
jgi:hypothetical protein